METEDLLEMEENTKSVSGTKSKEKRVSKISVIPRTTQKDTPRVGLYHQVRVQSQTTPNLRLQKTKSCSRYMPITGWQGIPLHIDALPSGPGQQPPAALPLAQEREWESS